MIYRLLYKLLHESEAIRNRVGIRIFEENAPERRPTDPKEEYIVLHLISENPDYHLDGEVGTGDAVVQVDCHGSHTSKARSLYQLVRNRLSGYRGSVADVLTDDGDLVSRDVCELTILRPGMIVGTPQDASDKWSYNCSTDISVFYEQSVPTLT